MTTLNGCGFVLEGIVHLDEWATTNLFATEEDSCV
jgi:hypothetical protein